MALSSDTALSLESRPRNLSDLVFETIQQAIVDKVLPPGEPLTEPGLAERLNVSKTPVREALLRLRQMGLIEQSGPRSLRVIQPSRDGIRHAYELREALESFAAARAAELAAPADREQIRTAAKRSLDAAKAGDLDGFRAADRELHGTIAGLADNPRIAQLIEDAGVVISTLLSRELPTGQGATDCAEGHVRIANAIAASDPDAAAREMTGHIRHVWSLALAGLAAQGADA